MNFSMSGQKLVTHAYSAGERFFIFDMKNNPPIVVKPISNTIQSYVSFSYDEMYLLYIITGEGIRKFHIESGKDELIPITGMRCWGFSVHSNGIAYARNGSIIITNMTGKYQNVLTPPRGWDTSLNYSSFHDQVLFSIRYHTEEITLNAWNMVTGQCKVLFSDCLLQINLKEKCQDGCAVCLADLDVGNQVYVIPFCAHIFHVSCLDPWLKRHKSCPICRRILLLKP